MFFSKFLVDDLRVLECRGQVACMCVVSRARVSYAYTYFNCGQQLRNPSFVRMSC